MCVYLTIDFFSLATRSFHLIFMTKYYTTALVVMLFKEMFDCSGNGLPPFAGQWKLCLVGLSEKKKKERQEKATFRSDEPSIQ